MSTPVLEPVTSHESWDFVVTCLITYPVVAVTSVFSDWFQVRGGHSSHPEI